APQMGRRAAPASVVEPEVKADETNGDVTGEPRGLLTAAQRVAVSTSAETVVDPFALEAKFFTEMRVLNRDVRIVLEGVDKFSNLIGSVYYPDGESAKDLALELVENHDYTVMRVSNKLVSCSYLSMRSVHLSLCCS
ncbi:nuclease domain-containing protein, partial [Trifolium medium]|nr:nuclease domain-containing protein [Trifolium medium]